MLDDFMKDLQTNATDKKLVDVNIMDTPVFNVQILYDKLSNIDSLSDKELYSILKIGYKELLEDIFKKDTPLYLSLLTNSKFITIFTQVMSTEMLDYDHTIYCNKIAYDYLTLSNNKDKYIEQLYYTLSKVVNRGIIPGLLSLGIPENLASYMALARYSSLKELINVERVNFIIVSSPKEVMTEQMIVWIYEKLFDRFTPLFEGTMFDVVKDEDDDQYNDDMLEVYSTISLAILDIMNNLPSQDIRKVLISYVGDYEILYRKPGEKTIRFSMRSLSDDYVRINQVVQALELENIYVP